MLPDFMRAKTEAQKSLLTVFRDYVDSEPLLAGTTRRRVFEGDHFTVGDTQGDASSGEFEHIESAVSVAFEDIIEKGIVAYLEALKRPAEELRTAQAKMLLEEIDKAVERTGNRSKGEFTFDTFIDAIDKIEIVFAPDGSPQMPSLFVSPEMGAKLAVLIKEWEQDPEKSKRVDEAMSRKKAEWDDRESHRRLVD